MYFELIDTCILRISIVALNLQSDSCSSILAAECKLLIFYIAVKSSRPFLLRIQGHTITS